MLFRAHGGLASALCPGLSPITLPEDHKIWRHCMVLCPESFSKIAFFIILRHDLCMVAAVCSLPEVGKDP